uniref:Zf-RVT domain-containing protein n=1 Tax=Panagrellus redivivus TaxID=6233 RepID=A0A7E4VUM6_PANRE
AQSTLQDDVRQKTKQPPTPEIVKDYLDGSTEGIFKDNSVTYSSIWTRLRISTRHLRRLFSMEWSCDSAGINLLIDEQRVRPADVEKQLKNAFHKYLAKKLAAKPDQGKVFNVASLSAASNHFLKNGNFTRFAEWRFIHKARLNVVPLRGSLKFNIGSKSCRKCEYSNETLAHVLNHCGTHMAAATKRHNAVAGRLEKVLPRNDHTSIYINQAVPGSNSDLRPDITVIDEKNRTATIIDTLPFPSKAAKWPWKKRVAERRKSTLASNNLSRNAASKPSVMPLSSDHSAATTRPTTPAFEDFESPIATPPS